MTAKPSAKPMPKVVSFQDRCRSRGSTARRLTAFLRAIPLRPRSTCFAAPTAASIPAYGKPNPENSALSSRRASSAICWRV